MKLQNIRDVDSFFNVIRQCKGNVYLISPEGDQLNLKSELCRYFTFAELLASETNFIKQLDLKIEDPEDTARLINYMIERE